MKIIKKYFNYILIVLCMVIISILCLWDLLKVHSIGIFPDELGYWSSAAIFSGYDWSTAMLQTPYYSFFYGIILIPIFNIFIDNPIYMFRAAIVLNTIILDACFVCAYLFLCRIDSDRTHFKKNIIAAFCVTIYPAYLLFSRVTLSENILLLITWLLTLEFDRYIKKQNTGDLFAIGVLSVMGYYSHQRFLAVIFALLISIFLIYMTNKKFNKKAIINIIFVVLGIIILFIIGMYTKSQFKSIAYRQAVSDIGNKNDYGSIIQKIIASFSIQGLMDISLSFVGKTFYIGIATFGMAYVAIYKMLKYLLTCIINKKIDNKFFMYLFITFSFLGSIFIATFFMHPRPKDGERFDTVIYGRYSEYLYGVVLIIAIDSLFKNYKDFFKLEIYSFMVEILLLILLSPNLIDNPSYAVQWLSCSAINDFFYGRNSLMLNAFCAIILRNGIVIILLALGIHIKKRQSIYYYNIALLFLAAYIFICSSVYTINNTYFDWKEKMYQQNQSIVEIIKNENRQKEIYCYQEDKYIVAIQFDMPKTFMYHVENIDEVPIDNLIITSNKYAGDSRLQLLKETNHLILWKVKE